MKDILKPMSLPMANDGETAGWMRDKTNATIGITGHRDRVADPERLRKMLAGAAKVVHGGARGFDTQAAQVAHELGIETVVIRPDYSLHGRGAPHVRNRQIVDACDYLIACYDGRQYGGTFRTIEYARKLGKRVLILELAEQE